MSTKGRGRCAQQRLCSPDRAQAVHKAHVVVVVVVVVVGGVCV